jgi:Holliday junction resolvasome RuvABC endonuclease subunit
LDLAPVSSGYSLINADGVYSGSFKFKDASDEHIEDFYDRINEIVRLSGAELVCIEDYSTIRRSNTVSIAQTGGVSKLAISQHGKILLKIHPSRVKSFALHGPESNSGLVKTKTPALAILQRVFPSLSCDKRSKEDMADSLVVCVMGVFSEAYVTNNIFCWAPNMAAYMSNGRGDGVADMLKKIRKERCERYG